MMRPLHPATVAIHWASKAEYPDDGAFSPSCEYPEYPFRGQMSKVPNRAYDAVRETFSLLGLDSRRFGSSGWNPLGAVIRPGDRVVLKPNLVLHDNEAHPGNWVSVITHGSIIRAVLDYAYIALEGKGELIVADAPHHDCDFELIRRYIRAAEITQFYARYARLPVEYRDLRQEYVECINGVSIRHTKLPGDPEGYVAFDLGKDSAIHDLGETLSRIYGSEYDRAEILRHHSATRHEYCISRTIMNADVVIGVPKLKTHKKVAITVNLKNLVGINGNKNWLPHFRVGGPAEGGDEFPAEHNGALKTVETTLKGALQDWHAWVPATARRVIAATKPVLGRYLGNSDDGRTVRGGNWHGNDTCWRTCIDLNRILMYGEVGSAAMRDVKVRRFFSVVDGIVGGENSGPMAPDAKSCGLVLAGPSALWTDAVCARVMGFEPMKVPTIREGARQTKWPLHDECAIEDVVCLSNVPELQGTLDRVRTTRFRFKPHYAWAGHLGEESL